MRYYIYLDKEFLRTLFSVFDDNNLNIENDDKSDMQNKMHRQLYKQQREDDVLVM